MAILGLLNIIAPLSAKTKNKGKKLGGEPCWLPSLMQGVALNLKEKTEIKFKYNPLLHL